MSLTEDHRRTLGQRLRRARSRARLSQRQLAERLGFSKDHVSRMEAGIKVATLETLLSWAGITNTAPEVFIAGLDDPEHRFVPDPRIIKQRSNGFGQPKRSRTVSEPSPPPKRTVRVLDPLAARRWAAR